ncbi:MAG: Arc family DNA-binding protein [Verrucomicrobiales bacterium]
MDARKSFLLRIDPELWKELEKWAQDELRSVNGQIEFILRQAVNRRKKGAGDAASSGGGSGASE